MSYYQILGVNKSATFDQIKKTYKKLALKYHPDKNSHNKQQAKQIFIKISEAYSILSNPQKRRNYDNIQNYQSSNSRAFGYKSSNQYQWKNPEFDPGFNHFQGSWNKAKKEGVKTNRENYGFFQNFNLNFGSFLKKEYTNVNFGQFTFQMAQQIFNEVFRAFQKSFQQFEGQQLGYKNPLKRLINSSSMNNPANQIKTYQPSKTYVPRNSTLISQKRIQRNGKSILVRKYSVTQNGNTHNQTHEQIIH